jgi:hypothetical protein
VRRSTTRTRSLTPNSSTSPSEAAPAATDR